MWRTLDVGEVPKVGDEWWYQEDVVSGGYWTPCIGPFVHIEVGKVVVRRKISERVEGQKPSTNTGKIEIGT